MSTPLQLSLFPFPYPDTMSIPPVTFPTASAHVDPRQQHGDDNPSLTWGGKNIKASDGYSALVRIIMIP